MKVLAYLELGFHPVYDRLRATGHEVIILEDGVLFEDVIDTYERERPDVFFWDPGAPIPERFRMVERLMKAVSNPPTVIFNAMPTEWTAYCANRPHNNICIVGPSTCDYDEILKEVTAQ